MFLLLLLSLSFFSLVVCRFYLHRVHSSRTAHELKGSDSRARDSSRIGRRWEVSKEGSERRFRLRERIRHQEEEEEKRAQKTIYILNRRARISYFSLSMLFSSEREGKENGETGQTEAETSHMSNGSRSSRLIVRSLYLFTTYSITTYSIFSHRPSFCMNDGSGWMVWSSIQIHYASKGTTGEKRNSQTGKEEKKGEMDVSSSCGKHFHIIISYSVPSSLWVKRLM